MSAPHFVAYSDQWRSKPPTVSEIKGFNVFILSFLLLQGAWDNAREWENLSDADRTSIKKQYANAGIKLMVSVFGSTDQPTTSGADPIATANKFADWVKKYKLDGIDVDYEDFPAFQNGKAEAWLAKFTKQLRAKLPSESYIITHAPVAPWFTPNRWPGGGYLKVHKDVGSLISWYNIQFYNQGITEYTTPQNLVVKSSSVWPKSAVLEIMASGVPGSKVVIGKPATAADASSGYMSPKTLASALQLGKNDKWNGGAMVWQFPNANAAWIKDVRSLSWPV